jgi:hypothetical protein
VRSKVSKEDQTTLKQCTRCNEWKPADLEHFGALKAGHLGLNPVCRDCYNRLNREKSAGLKALKPKPDPIYSRALKRWPSLAISHPELAAQWHPTKNSPILPIHVTAGSQKKVWWKCPVDSRHVWQANIKNRSKQPGCPFCLGRLAAPDSNLEVLHPELAQEWDQDRNGSLKPSDVRPGSSRKVWWKCSLGHQWQAAIGSRTAGRGCPVCANRVVHTDNNLATLFPELAKEWHLHLNEDLTPNDVVSGSHRKVWWQCKKNPTHEWRTSVVKRVSRGSGCPFCNAGSATSITELRVYAELSALFERVEIRTKVDGMECDVFLPDANVAVEIDGGYWHKDKKEKDLIKNRKLSVAGITLFRFRESSLPLLMGTDTHYTSPKATFADLRNLIQKISTVQGLTDKTLANIHGYLERSEFTNDDFFMDLLDRLPNPFPGRSLAELNPRLASEWHPTKNGRLTPDAVLPSSNQKAWWVCASNPDHVWQAAIGSRTAGRGCPYCAGRATDESNSLAALRPDLASEWHPTKNGNLTPNDVVPGSEKQVWWQCHEDAAHVWKIRVADRSKGTGCPYCSGRRATAENNLSVAYPDIASEWHPTKNGDVSPSDVTPNSDKHVWWQCSKDSSHVWESIIGNRTRLGRGCPYCAGQRVTPSNNLAAAFPEIAKQWHPTKNGGLQPHMVMPKTHKTVWWKCPNNPNHEWQAQVSNRTNGAGCPFCYKERRSHLA